MAETENTECGHEWMINAPTPAVHTCGESAGHTGPHKCALGSCSVTKTTGTTEIERLTAAHRQLERRVAALESRLMLDM